MFGDLSTTWFSREKCVFYAYWTVFKNFSVFPWTFVTVHCLPRLSLSNSPCHSKKTTIVVHHFYFNLQKKGMGFLILTKYFMFLALISLIFELMLNFENPEFQIWVGFILMSLLNVYCCHWVYDTWYTCFCVFFSFFSSISCLYCTVHFMLVLECHNDSYLWLYGVHWLHCT